MQPGELPASLSRLVGREEELVELQKLLSQARLLTLVGSGGVGKTRLALELARTVQDKYADGVCLVQVAALSDPDLVEQMVAVAAGVRERPDRPLLEQLAQTLRSQQMLLVLDNCEHLLDACASLVELLLATCPSLTILTTSRARLGLTGERTWRVPSLPFPVVHPLPPLDTLVDYPAVRLFVDRASEAHPGFGLTSASDAVALASICSDLDGIPLALELAAARTSVLSLLELAARLNDRFTLLTGGRRTGLPRQQTLRASVAWSYDLLSDEEKAAFQCLSVFVGGWTLEAATAATGGDALDILAQLVDQSLVQTSERVGATRYVFLETVRAFAAERLAESDPGDVTRERHAMYFLALAEQAGRAVRGQDQRASIERLQLENDNLRAAAYWCTADPDRSGLGLRLAAALTEFWHVRGYLAEATRWLERALEADPGPSLARAEALDGLGVMVSLRGDHDRAAALFATSADLFLRLGHQAGNAHALSNAALASMFRGNPLQAVQWAKQALTVARAAEDQWAEAYAHYSLGWAGYYSEDHDLSMRAAADAALLFGTVGDQRGRAFSLQLIGVLHMDAGQAGEAISLLREAGAIFASLDDTWGALVAMLQLVRGEAAAGRAVRAGRLLGAADALRERMGVELVPPLQQARERGTALAHSYVGAAAFSDAVAAGRALSPAQAVIEAFSPSEAVVSPDPARTTASHLLTRREREVAAHVCSGASNREISAALGLSERSVETYVSAILRRLNLRSRTQLTVWALEHNLTPPYH